jgi:hypothetical protein
MRARAPLVNFKREPSENATLVSASPTMLPSLAELPLMR